MDEIRSFVAIPLPFELQQRLVCLQQQLKQRLPELRLTAVENLHVSLQFLGNQSSALLDKVGELMASTAAATPPFTLELSGLEAWPRARQPRIICLAVEAAPTLLSLQLALATGLSKLGVAGETRPYQPHLTLARLRRFAVPAEIPAPLQQSRCGRLEVSHIVLFSSCLTAQGALHRPLRAVELSGSAENGGR